MQLADRCFYFNFINILIIIFYILLVLGEIQIEIEAGRDIYIYSKNIAECEWFQGQKLVRGRGGGVEEDK